jgi:Tfp pilus assembly protein PilO
MIWREKRVLLIVLAVILAANTIFFFTYRVQYQSRLDAMDQKLADAETQLRSAKADRAKAESSLASYRRIERDVQEIYDHHWATQAERLTAMIGEVKRLAVASALVPPAYAFDKTAVQAQNTGNRRRAEPIGASEVGIAFSVSGTYDQARRLINLLELSRQFVIIDSISLVAREGNQLTLNLHVKTLFRDDRPAPAAANNRL